MAKKSKGGGSRGFLATLTSKTGLILIAGGALAGLAALGQINESKPGDNWYSLGVKLKLRPKV